MMIAGTERRRQGCSLQDGKQWGYYVESQNPTDYRYWSIPFTSHYITMATKTYYEPKEEAVPWLVGIDMQKFICGYGANFIGSSYVSCVGIGCQLQWGENVGGGAQTVSLPISFEVAFTAVVSADSSWCNASCHITTTTITTMNYQSNKPDIAQLGPVQWLAIGIQPQWGFDSGTAEKNIVILPLPVINPLSGFACLTDSNGAGDIGIKSMSSTSIVVDVDTNKAASRNFYWLVIAL